MAVAPVGAAFVGVAAADPWRVGATNLAGAAVNQLAIDPMVNDVVWAATSRGLYRPTPGPPTQWTLVNTGLEGEASAVVVFSGAAAGKQTIYIATVGGRVARSVDDGANWQPIALPAFPSADLVPNTEVAVVRLAPGNVPGRTVVYALADGPRLWRIDGAAAQTVGGLPRAISERDPDAPHRFGLALAVHPETDAAHQDVIAVGGLAFAFPTVDRRQAALYSGQVTLLAGQYTVPNAAPVDGAPAEWIGSGMPPGVQVLKWNQAGRGRSHAPVARRRRRRLSIDGGTVTKTLTKPSPESPCRLQFQAGAAFLGKFPTPWYTPRSVPM